MIHTLPDNYSKNLEVMKINLSRGLDASFAYQAVKNMKQRFINANLYGEAEKQFINQMTEAIEAHIEKHTGIKVKLEAEA